jgi:hypothetical protein
MSLESIKLYVNQDSIRSGAEEQDIYAKATKRGELCVMDWYTEMSLEKRVFGVRYGLQAAPMTGDQPIATTAAESCVDPGNDMIVIPFDGVFSLETAAGTVNDIRGVIVPTASSGGDAYTPLNQWLGGPSCRSTARCDETGGVTVTAEAEATSVLCFSQIAPIAVAANATPRLGYDWKPMAPPVVPEDYCFYVQIGGTTTSPTYHLRYSFVELPLDNVD